MEFEKKFKVLKIFEKLKNNQNDNSNLMFTFTSWFDREPVFDIRWWHQYNDDFTNRPIKGKGITLNESEMELIVQHYLEWKKNKKITAL